MNQNRVVPTRAGIHISDEVMCYIENGFLPARERHNVRIEIDTLLMQHGTILP